MLRVGRTVLGKHKKIYEPEYKNFHKVVLDSDYKELSSPHLKDNNGYIVENIWQFSKVYNKIKPIKQNIIKDDKEITVWEHPAETHTDNNEINDKFKKWREKGLHNKYPVKYPDGLKCLYYLEDVDKCEKLDLINARKRIYIPNYCKFVKKQPKFKRLRKMLDKGEDILIVDNDGPHQESLPYYMGKYGVKKSFIDKNTVLINEKNAKLLLNDPKHDFSHGFCLAIALLGIDKKLCS